MKLLVRPRAKQGDQVLEVFNGIRVLCCAFVILGNTFFYILKGPLQNLEAAQQWIHSYFFAYVLSADLAVDVFFWMAAFLGSY